MPFIYISIMHFGNTAFWHRKKKRQATIKRSRVITKIGKEFITFLSEEYM